MRFRNPSRTPRYASSCSASVPLTRDGSGKLQCNRRLAFGKKGQLSFALIPDGDHRIGTLIDVWIKGLAGLVLDVDADFSHDTNCKRADCGRFCPCRMHLNVRGGEMAKQPFRHLTSRRVMGTEEQHTPGHCYLQQPEEPHPPTVATGSSGNVALAGFLARMNALASRPSACFHSSE